jgi:hypothetical protein
MRLVVSMPTRGRPQQLIETIKRNLACLSRPDTVLMIQADEDDTETIKAMARDSRVVLSIKPREDTIAAKWNRALVVEADVYTCLGDDDPLATLDADEKILHAASLFPDGIGAVYGHLANASFSGVISFTKKMTDLFGYIQPEYFPYWFCDHWTDDVSRITGRIAFADVRTDQSKVGKTQEMREPGWWATWFDANYMVRRKQAAYIIEALDEPAWRKEILCSHAPLIEFRSRWINDTVRARARELEAWSGLTKPDERYMRIRQKAVDMLPAILETLPPAEAHIYREMLTPPNTIVNLQRAFG